MTKQLAFETNGSQLLEFIAGEMLTVYFLLKYVNANEYFAHSLSFPAKVRIKNTDGSIAEFLGQLVCYYPACFVIVVMPDKSALLTPGNGQDIEIEVYDINGQLHIAQRAKSLNIKPKLMS
jgi:hypothetical protein